MLHTIDFKVTGQQTIHCAGCEQRISRALRSIPGVQDVQASNQTQQVLVGIDPALVGPVQVQAKLEQLGYEVTSEGGTS